VRAQAISLAEREEISRGLAAGLSLRAIAAGLGRAPSTISLEVAGHGGRRGYRAASADQQAWSRARRRKVCKLATRPALRAIVGEQLRKRWSPEQIAGWLKATYPNDPEMQVSQETICRTLFTPVPRGTPQRTDCVSADRSGDPTPGGNPATGWPRWPAGDPQHLRAAS
jgi:IS30 family transposase